MPSSTSLWLLVTILAIGVSCTTIPDEQGTASTGSSAGGSGGAKSSCAAPCDDGDPCTDDYCDQEECLTRPSADGTNCGGVKQCASGKCVVPPTLVVAGGLFTCAIKADATVWCWGDNSYGGLGIGKTWMQLNYTRKPVQVKDSTGKGVFSNAVVLGVGAWHACAGRSAGADQGLWCWGSGFAGQLGDATMMDSSLPVRVHGAGGTGFLWGATNIATSPGATCVTRNAGDSWCWGEGPLGDGGLNSSSFPVNIALPGQITQFALGGEKASCAKTSSSALYCWGDNGYGELGNGTWSAGSVPSPVQVGSGIAEVQRGFDHTCAVVTGQTLKDQSVRCWGLNDSGQLGASSKEKCFGNSPCSTTPVDVAGPAGTPRLQDVAHIAAGDAFTCALTSTSANIYCWGFGDQGRLGNGEMASSPIPVQVVGVGGTGKLTATSISASGTGSHACALTPERRIACWGDNTYGQLGDGTTKSSAVPVLVLPF